MPALNVANAFQIAQSLISMAMKLLLQEVLLIYWVLIKEKRFRLIKMLRIFLRPVFYAPLVLVYVQILSQQTHLLRIFSMKLPKNTELLGLREYFSTF